MTHHSLDFDFITNQLMVGVTPKARDYARLKDLGVTLIINMRAERYAVPIGSRTAIKTVWVPTLDSRFLPIKAHRLMKAIHLAVKTMDQHGKVYVYCHVGRHRSVLMGAAILIARGDSVEAAIQKIKTKRLIADPDIPHIHRAIVNFAEAWKQRTGSR